ncbi:MAG: hypothetical protein PHG24_02750 [Candidatus Pacebacteria bacterium]|nr:hypothetical protein [Candidatus Paceibacterota bacterium]
MCENCILTAAKDNFTVIIEGEVPDCEDYLKFVEDNEGTPAKAYRETRTLEPTVGFELKKMRCPALLFGCKELQATKGIKLFIENIDFFEPFEVRISLRRSDGKRYLSFTKNVQTL